MSRRPKLSRRLATAARWPLGIGLTSWRYMWRTTPMHRREQAGTLERDGPPSLPPTFDDAEVQTGDEYIVRMPGPWDGPVRVVEVTPTSFRLVTLDGHLEAGQIQFRIESDSQILFSIESWARSADLLVHLLYDRVRMAKETQLHMWTSMLEGVARLSGGRMTGGVDIDTRRVHEIPVG